jgi:hypothetical protein
MVLLPYLMKHAFVFHCIPMTYTHGHPKVYPGWQHTQAYGSCTLMHATSSKHIIRAGIPSLSAFANHTQLA